MTTVLKATDCADLLAVIPSLAGFTPRQSIVLLPFCGTRASGAMRMDLPKEGIDLAEFADAAIELCARVRGTDAVAVVAYTDEGPQQTPEGVRAPQSDAIEHLLDAAAGAQLRIVEALSVTPEGWLCHLDDEPRFAPLDTIPAPPQVPGIADVSGDQMTGAALPDSDLATRESVGRALSALTAATECAEAGGVTGREDPQALAALALLDDVIALFEDVLETPENLPPYVSAALLWCLSNPLFRDVALAQWARDRAAGERALDAQLAYSRAKTGVPEEFGGFFLGRGPAPDADRLRIALTTVRTVAAAAPRAARPGPLTAAAWLSWALGRSTHAHHYLELAREIDADYSLAKLMQQMLDAAILPQWALDQRPSSAR